MSILIFNQLGHGYYSRIQNLNNRNCNDLITIALAGVVRIQWSFVTMRNVRVCRGNTQYYGSLRSWERT